MAYSTSSRVGKPPPDFLAWSGAHQARIEQVLSDVLPNSGSAPQRLHSAMRYAVLGRGKRVRPLLAFAAGELSGADPDRVAIAGAAVELIHAYSLAHDDLPCMDDDVLRRGKPTCHVEYDEATALLAGDSLHSLAFQLLAEYRLTASGSQLEMVRLLAQAAGSRGMAGGQAIDLEAEGRSLSVPELEYMHIHKTGALIRASVMLGAHCGNGVNGEGLKALDHYAKYIGLTFQVVDDVLDAESSTATLGKTAGKDSSRSKPTYVSTLGVNAARRLASELKDEALSSLTPFAERATRLSELAEFIVSREF
jgi:farnesyl diphosphate synthase